MHTAAATRIPTVLGSLGDCLWKQLADLSRLTVEIASEKLVRTWTEKLLFQLFSDLNQKEGEIEIKMLCNRQETAVEARNWE